MKRLLISIAILLMIVTFADAQNISRLCYTTNGSNCVSSVQASNSKPISTASAATTELVSLVSGKSIFVTSYDFMSAGTSNVTLVYGTGTNCGTGTTSLTGAYPLIAQAGISKGNGTGIVLVVPAGNAFCITNSQAIQISGSTSYAQF